LCHGLIVRSLNFSNSKSNPEWSNKMKIGSWWGRVFEIVGFLQILLVKPATTWLYNRLKLISCTLFN
jgi:hypothetical protein